MMRNEPNFLAEWCLRGIPLQLMLSILLVSSSAAKADSTTGTCEPQDDRPYLTHYLATSPFDAVIRPELGRVRLCQPLNLLRYSVFTCNVSTTVRVRNRPNGPIPHFAVESHLVVRDEDGEVLYRNGQTNGQCYFNDPTDDRCETVVSGRLRVGWANLSRTKSAPSSRPKAHWPRKSLFQSGWRSRATSTVFRSRDLYGRTGRR